MQHLIVFEVGSQQLALKAEIVVEIIRAVEVTLLPDLELPFMGVINYRGSVVSVIRVGSLLGFKVVAPTVNEQMIIVGDSAGSSQICLLVDQVVAFAVADEIQSLAELGSAGIQTRFTTELAKLNTSLLPIFAVDSLLGRVGEVTPPEFRLHSNSSGIKAVL
ncbi:MAG: chemotaxis protein CheW [Chloroflexi bacterium]|nr:chemotaxis protein CheW [Chloroflexota bacterium]